MTPPIKPRAKPCGSCPYRRDVPAGVWHPEEYAKLPKYDAPTAWQPQGVFMCHTQDGSVCAGWLGCHGSLNLLAVRLAMIKGADPASFAMPSESIPLFGSGAEAARHGLSGVERPKAAARTVILKLSRMKGRKR